jgi:hypothetical protein
MDDAAVGAAPQATLARSELLEVRKRARRSESPVLTLLKSWWLYPLLGAIAVCVYFGIQSASTPLPLDRPVVIITAIPTP